jgi:hypothetical protein
MDQDSFSFFATSILAALFIALIWRKLWLKKVSKLLSEYKNTIESGDRQKAVEAGRKYYSFRAGGFGLRNTFIGYENQILEDLKNMKEK